MLLRCVAQQLHHQTKGCQWPSYSTVSRFFAAVFHQFVGVTLKTVATEAEWILIGLELMDVKQQF